MASKIIAGMVSAAFVLTLLGWTLRAEEQQQQASFQLSDDHQVDGVVLKAGKYLLIHRSHEAAQAGEACMLFYQPPTRQEKNVVAQLHCRPSSGTQARDFTMKTLRQPDGTRRIQSVQFAGSSDVHELVSAN